MVDGLVDERLAQRMILADAVDRLPVRQARECRLLDLAVADRQ